MFKEKEKIFSERAYAAMFIRALMDDTLSRGQKDRLVEMWNEDHRRKV